LKEANGIIFNIQEFSIHDGPGIRTTMFLKGCPLRCPWCSNPESLEPAVQIRISVEKCRGCGKCLEACNHGALALLDGRVFYRRESCCGCLSCADACKNGCIAKTGVHVTAYEAAERLLRDRLFYENTGGGITLSGGEPLLQHEFTSEVFKIMQAKGVHTALDTSGFASCEALLSVIEHTDLVLFDIKHLNHSRHIATIGVDNGIILRNLRKCSGRTRIWIRTPLIPGFNDDSGTVEAIVKLASEVGAERCCFLPMHRWGEQKYSRLGLPNPYERLGEFPAHELTLLKERYRSQDKFVYFVTA